MDFLSGEPVPSSELPANRPRSIPFQLPALAVILLISAGLNFWQLDRLGYGNTYYAAAVRSMMQSWHNFFFNSFDPGGFVTIDKPPLGFWFQVLSAKLFGYNGVSLLLPEALAGVLSVALLYYLVKRVFGTGAGLLAALVMALMPVCVAADRSNIIDGILVLFLLLGAWAVSRAVENRHTGLRWLLLCAVFVGLGFNVKMLEAFLVVPAFGLAYLLGAQAAWRARVAHLLLATVVLLVVSLSWATAVDLTPASQRPWVDSTSTNSEIDLAIGYNGLDRLLGRSSGPGSSGRGFTPSAPSNPGGAAPAVPGNPGAAQPAAGGPAFTPAGPTDGRGGGGGLFNNGAAGPLRLIGSELGSQVGWLIPLALIALVAAVSRRLRFPLDPQQKATVLWGAWLLTTIGFFSVANFFHSYYLVTMAPAVAALAGVGLVTLWRDYLRYPSLSYWRGWLLPVALLLTALAQAYILSGFPDWSRWLTPLAIAGVMAANLVLVWARLHPRRALRIWTPAAAAVGAIALLAAPSVWAQQTVASGGGGLTPTAGPTTAFGGGFGGFGRRGNRGFNDGGLGRQGGGQFGGLTQTELRRLFAGGFPGGPGGGAADGGTAQSGLLRYLEARQGSTTFLFAVGSSNAAAPYIIQTGKAVMSLGGFSGSNPILNVPQFQALVRNNTVRYVMGGGGGFGGFGGRDGGSGVLQWVQTACAVVPASAYQSTSAATPAGGIPGAPGGFGGRGGGQTLYDCKGA